MVKNDFLDAIQAFTQEHIKDMILPCRVQSATEAQTYRAADVYKMRLPDANSSTKRAPYIVHSIITSSDSQQPGERTQSYVQLRSVFCIYCADDQEGPLMLMELMERFRFSAMSKRIIGNRYKLDLSTPMESLYYPDDTAPYFLGETVSTWEIPTVEMEVSKWLR